MSIPFLVWKALASKILLRYMYRMQKQDTSIAIRVNKDWLIKLDAWIAAQPIKPSRTEVFRVAIDRLMSDADSVKTRRSKRSKS
jgi:hypothetical protein